MHRATLVLFLAEILAFGGVLAPANLQNAANPGSTAARPAWSIPAASQSRITFAVWPSPGQPPSLPPAAPLFLDAPYSATGRNPYLIASGDFDGDGKIDVVTADNGGNAVSVLLGNGDGTFQAPVDYPVQAAPSSLAVGDFNGDGRLDLAVTNQCGKDHFCSSHGTVSILLGNGDGTFAEQKSFSSRGFYPHSVAVGDFNNDGKQDLAVANICGRDPECVSGGTVILLLGNGDGTFKNGSSTQFGRLGYPNFVAAGDLNGDGNADLVVADGGNAVHVLLGNGDGTFQRQQSYPTGNFSSAIAIADFNGDGIPDLAVANADGENSYPGNVSVLLGNGDGTFQRRKDYSTGVEPNSVIAGDFNGDGKMDLAIANIVGDSVSILLGNGDGTFQPPVDFGAGGGARSLVAGDFNGDGKLDLVTADDFGNAELNTGTVSVLLGNGDGSFHTRIDHPILGNPSAVAVADLNGDGHTDVVLATNAGASRGSVRVFLSNGDGTFQPSKQYPSGVDPFSIAAGDFNGDGKMDLVTANFFEGGVTVLLGNGDGSFQPPVGYPTGFSPYFVAVGDFNGDGKLDLAVVNSASATVSLLLGNGDGTFKPHVDYATGLSPYSVAVGDFNHDGKLDLAVVNYCGSDPTCSSGGTYGSVSILLGNGDGTFQSHVDYNVGKNPIAVAVGDFKGNGILDLAVTNYQSFNVSVLLGRGDGTFHNAVVYGSVFTPASVAVADYNGDGKLDLVTANQFDNTVGVFLGNGDGTFQPPIILTVGGQPISVVAADFNGDGRPDLAVANNAGLSLSILLNTGTAAPADVARPGKQ